MTTKRKLTPDEWAAARRRWEGDAQAGFDWLAAEVRGWLAVDITRQAVGDMARRKGWQKGGAPSTPLPHSHLAQDGGSLAQDAQVPARAIAIGKKAGGRPDGPTEPSEKPPGYAGNGRPTKYRPEYAAAMVAYFDREPFTDHEVEQPSGFTKLQRMPTDPPMLVGFAKSIGVTTETLGDWAKAIGLDGKLKYPEFSDAFAHARDLQASLLARGAALGMYDGRFLVFIMKNLHGWQDQPARDVAVTPVSAEELDRLYGSRMEAARERRRMIAVERAHLLGED